MIERILIILKWVFISAIFFVVLNIFLPGFIASIISMVITAGAFFHPENEKEASKLRRSVIILGQ